MLRRAVALAVSFALAGTTLSYAQGEAVATSGAVSGPVLVNHGVGYAPLGSAAPLAVGDRVMARHGGTATIIYADGCAIHVNPGTVYTIDGSSCRGPGVAPAAQVGGPSWCDSDHNNCPALAGLLIAGGIAAAGITLLASPQHTSSSPFFVTPSVSH